jgi:Fe-S cluster biogenesis protein NfuA
MEDHPLLPSINTALQGIRPYLEADGGDVRVVEITSDMEVKIEFMGACTSCTMSALTFRGGVEDAILKAVPEVTKVTALNLTAINR